ncbi:hypothetical protein [Marinicella gelatinilytica]|uniref:hypothetical protein n=1 Tax=Marinicella gelatinilytica TaxID=2996017 RepID=UPI002260E42B|nr:hypothetical protein [Marinicella gelatinilytica]MCX7545034.1 hypothetical protein [Marinicella gelatinilytica]
MAKLIRLSSLAKAKTAKRMIVVGSLRFASAHHSTLLLRTGWSGVQLNRQDCRFERTLVRPEGRSAWMH